VKSLCGAWGGGPEDRHQGDEVGQHGHRQLRPYARLLQGHDRNVILLGGDTDTTPAMAGAFLGLSAIPRTLIDRVEETPKGQSYIIELSDRLLATHRRGAGDEASY
jgi:hypothetical protein